MIDSLSAFYCKFSQLAGSSRKERKKERKYIFFFIHTFLFFLAIDGHGGKSSCHQGFFMCKARFLKKCLKHCLVSTFLSIDIIYKFRFYFQYRFYLLISLVLAEAFILFYFYFIYGKPKFHCLPTVNKRFRFFRNIDLDDFLVTINLSVKS